MGRRQASRSLAPSTRARTHGRRWVHALIGLVTIAAVAGLVVLAARALRPAAVTRDPGLSVLVVSVDTLRADALGCYGRSDARTPWIDRIAADGVRFETARAHNVVTLPSHANLLSGQYPLRHGVRDNTGFRFPAERATLATILREKGWRTGAFVSAFPLDSRFGLDRGFEVYDDRLGGTDTSAFAMPERPGTETVRAALRWIDSVRGQRWLAFVHLYEPHFPYEPPAALASSLGAAPYQGEVAAADAALAPLLEPLLAAAGTGRMLVVFTSDHGESLGEHGEVTHGIFAYEATLRVPLLLRAPGLLPAEVVRTPVRHVDVLPTVLDLLGLEAPHDLPGRSLLPLVAGQDDAALELLRVAVAVAQPGLGAAARRGRRRAQGTWTCRCPSSTTSPPTRASRGTWPPRGRRTWTGSREPGAAARGEGRGSPRQEEEATLERLRALGYVPARRAAGNATRRTTTPRRSLTSTPASSR